jgi:hypothetical protein
MHKKNHMSDIILIMWTQQSVFMERRWMFGQPYNKNQWNASNAQCASFMQKSEAKYFFFFFFFFFFSYSHLEHRASVKCFVSLQLLNLRQLLGFLGRGISPSQGRYLTQTQNKHRHPCLECDSNPQSQRSSGRRDFMP